MQIDGKRLARFLRCQTLGDIARTLVFEGSDHVPMLPEHGDSRKLYLGLVG